MDDDKPISDLILFPKDPTGMLQIFTGKRPESPDGADMSKLLREIPVKYKEADHER